MNQDCDLASYKICAVGDEENATKMSATQSKEQAFEQLAESNVVFMRPRIHAWPQAYYAEPRIHNELQQEATEQATGCDPPTWGIRRMRSDLQVCRGDSHQLYAQATQRQPQRQMQRKGPT